MGVCNTTRRRTIGAVMNDSNHGVMNDDDVFTLENPSVPAPHSDMSGDNAEESQQYLGVQKITSSPTGTRTSIVNEFASKISSNECKYKIRSMTNRCRTGINANIRLHLVNAYEKSKITLEKPGNK